MPEQQWLYFGEVGAQPRTRCLLQYGFGRVSPSQAGRDTEQGNFPDARSLSYQDVQKRVEQAWPLAVCLGHDGMPCCGEALPLLDFLVLPRRKILLFRHFVTKPCPYELSHVGGFFFGSFSGLFLVFFFLQKGRQEETIRKGGRKEGRNT